MSDALRKSIAEVGDFWTEHDRVRYDLTDFQDAWANAPDEIKSRVRYATGFFHYRNTERFPDGSRGTFTITHHQFLDIVAFLLTEGDIKHGVKSGLLPERVLDKRTVDEREIAYMMGDRSGKNAPLTP